MDNGITSSDIAQALASARAKRIDAQREYKAVARELRGRPLVERATGLLNYWANAQNEWGDEEAAVFLASRGMDIEQALEAIESTWAIAAKEAIEHAMAGNPELKREQVEQVSNIPESVMPDFWPRDQYRASYVDASVFRVFEWCRPKGFDRWRDRLVTSTRETLYRSDIEPAAAAFWLFFTSRSQQAVNELRDPMTRVLRVIEQGELGGKDPWLYLLPGRPVPRVAGHVPTAACIPFAGARLGQPNLTGGLPDRAIEFLLATQSSDGGWPCWQGDSSLSIECTAMAIHALCVMSRSGHYAALSQAISWLRDSAHADGYWAEKWCDPVFLSVFVLDAIELANGRDTTTISGELSMQQHTRRFRVAVSFAGEVRNCIEPFVHELVSTFGQAPILYDRFHAAEFARPNLDAHLQNLYRNESDIVVVVLSADYQTKSWCGLEWRAIRDLGIEDDSRIMYMKLGDFELPGFFPSLDGYIDIEYLNPKVIADYVLERHRQVVRPGASGR